MTHNQGRLHMQAQNLLQLAMLLGILLHQFHRHLKPINTLVL